GERVDPVPRSTALLEPGDHRLRGTHAGGELALADPGLGSQVVDQLTYGEVLFDCGARLGGGRPALALCVVPAGVVRHVVSPSRIPSDTVDGCATCSVDLDAFVVALLAERGEQHDPSILGEAVRDPPSGRAERESQLEQAISERTRDRHPSLRS